MNVTDRSIRLAKEKIEFWRKASEDVERSGEDREKFKNITFGAEYVLGGLTMSDSFKKFLDKNGLGDKYI